MQMEESKKFIKFAIVGVMNTLINWVIFIGLNYIGVYYITANVVANIVAMIHSYFWNSIWVFKYKDGSKIKASIKFIFLNLIGLLINTLIMYILVSILGVNKMISLVVATGIVMVLNYVVNKLWVFKN